MPSGYVCGIEDFDDLFFTSHMREKLCEHTTYDIQHLLQLEHLGLVIVEKLCPCLYQTSRDLEPNVSH
jgi:hypothetical protein